MRADRLLDDLWAGVPTNRNTLQQKVARLRRSLGDPSLLAGVDGGYRLEIEPDAVDALRVLRDVDSAQMAMVQVAKDLAAKGEIMLAGSGGDDELIY